MDYTDYVLQFGELSSLKVGKENRELFNICGVVVINLIPNKMKGKKNSYILKVIILILTM